MGRVRLFFAIILLLGLPWAAHAGILNLRGGVGTVVQKDRDAGDSTRYGALHLSTTYRTPVLNFALDVPLRWEVESRDFDSAVWKRKGDWLRPLKLLRYGSETDRIRGGLEVINKWTPGGGYLVRELTGRGEVDYVLPGLKIGWSEESFQLDAGMDRPIDPTVQAVGIRWRPVAGVTLILEGAVDPEAPVSFSGRSSGGRPVGDDTDRLTAQAAGVSFNLLEGDILDISVGAHAGDINGVAKGTGGDISAKVDFTHNYLHRLQMRIGTVSCKEGYVPAWFDAAYPVQRWGPNGQPFLAVNPLDGTIPDRRMQIYDLRYDLGDFFSISGGWDRFTDDSMERGRFSAQLREENGRGLELSLWSRADGPDVRLFTEEANLHSRASALYNFLPHFLVSVSFEHSWAFLEEEAGFKPLNSITLGVLYDISL